MATWNGNQPAMESPVSPAMGNQVSDASPDARPPTEVDDNDEGVGLKTIGSEPVDVGRVRTSREESIDERRKELIGKLGLSEYFPKGLSLQKLMCKPIPGPESEICKQLPWVMLWKLIMIDYNGRNVNLSSACAPQADTSPENMSSDEDSSGEDDSSSDENESEPCQDSPHPMDVFLALFACCDDMLRQTLVQKMNMCRLAVPFILQDAESGKLQMCLWSMRSIVPEWREPQTGVVHEASIVNQPMDIISFIRIKDPAMSKSKLLNDVISDTSQSQPKEGTFFHRDCIGGMRSRKLADGFIEASWILPTEKDVSLAQKPVMFLNLRGNAIEKRQQVGVMTSISSAVVVLVDFSDLSKEDVVSTLEKLHGKNSNTILVVTPPERDVPKPREIKVAFESKGKLNFLRTSGNRKKRKPILCFQRNKPGLRSSGEITQDIRKMITQVLEPEGQRRLEAVTNSLRERGIEIDEDDEDCQRGKYLQQQITSKMDGRPLRDCKEETLPLQGPAWLKLCEQQRRQLRSGTKGNAASYEERERLQNEKMQFRTNQLEKLKYNKTMILFTETLSANIDNLRTVSFFIQWLRLYLDNRSRKTLPPLRKQYLDCLDKVTKGKDEHNADLEKPMEEIAKAGQDLLDASFGLEHLLRETGQIYEAAVEAAKHQSEGVQSCLPNYPELAAKLLLQGHPIEIMDGNASVVPLCWVQSIFRSLRQIVGDKKIFVVSALGVQSSGKSTLLNTMFGLQFPVSAGRCTKGLYMQLFEVDEDLPFQFVVVIDTEGLRAPELDSDNCDHDNELATLVIGLGDVTILNIKGESIAEMKNVLQIVVHVFLRMKIVNKQINLQQSCIFVYQNVAAVGANEQMMPGRRRLLESLDKMTKQAAEQENLTGIETFKKVIDFNEDKHVWCFSDLWQGDPPMAPANPGYSKCANEVKDCIINDIARNRQTFLTIGDMETHIGDLWKGVLCEDFVFCFRSSLSIAAYVKLEEFFRELLWELKNHMFQWLQEEAKNKIDECKNGEDLRKECIVLGSDLEDRVCQRKVEECMKRLNDYFEQDNLRYISIQWKEIKKATLKLIATTCVSEGKEEITRLGDIRRVDLESGREDVECIMHENVDKLVDELRGRSLSDPEIEREFQKMWADEIKKMNIKQPRDSSLETKQAVDRVLSEWFITEKIYLGQARDDLPEDLFLTQQGDEYGNLLDSMDHIKLSDDDHLSIIQGPSFAFGHQEGEKVDKNKHPHFAREIIKDILKKIDRYLYRICSIDQNFQRRFAEEIIRMAADGIESHNKKVSAVPGEFLFKPNIKVKIAVYVCRFATQRFIQMQRYYDHKHGLIGKLESFKSRIWKVFESRVGHGEVEIIAADLVGDILKEGATRMIRLALPNEMVQDTLRYFKYRNNGKGNLNAEILEDLASRDSFEDYISYISDAAEYAFHWLKRFMERRYFLADDNVNSLEQTDANASMKTERESLETRQLWAKKILKQFENALKDTQQYIRAAGNPTISRLLQKLCSKLGISEKKMQDVLKYNVTNFPKFLEELKKRLNAIKKTVMKDIKMKPPSDTFRWETQETPYEMAFNQLWGCKEQCPICSAPCMFGNTPRHRHQCIQHRPMGVNVPAHQVRWLRIRELISERLSSRDQFIESCNHIVYSLGLYRRFRIGRPRHDYYADDDDMTPWHGSWYYDGCDDDEINWQRQRLHQYFDLDNWDIPPDTATKSNEYWMWFMAKYNKQLYTRLHQPEGLTKLPLPRNWYRITKEQAINSLRKYDGRDRRGLALALLEEPSSDEEGHSSDVEDFSKDEGVGGRL